MTATDKELNLPFYAKASLILIGLYVLISMLYIGQSIIIPLVFAVIFAIVLHPIVTFFVRMRINRIIAIIITIFLTFIVIASIALLIISQVSQFSQSWPILVDKLTAMLNETITNASGYFDINPEKFQISVKKTISELLNISNAMIGQTLVAAGNLLVVLLLIPTYIFIILYYHSLLIEFIHRLFGKDDHSKVTEIVTQTKTVIQQYLVGLGLEAMIVAVLEIAVLLILGIEYAILLGIIGALLNVIPYIGGIVAVALPMMVALATKSTAWYAIYVLILYYIIQLIDNNYIVPIIVSSKVKINALFSIIVVFAGNALWGIPGMFISIPILAIIKVVFDHIDALKPWGFLLGDTMPSFLKMKPLFKKKPNQYD